MHTKSSVLVQISAKRCNKAIFLAQHPLIMCMVEDMVSLHITTSGKHAMIHVISKNAFQSFGQY